MPDIYIHGNMQNEDKQIKHLKLHAKHGNTKHTKKTFPCSESTVTIKQYIKFLHRNSNIIENKDYI